VKTAIAKKIPKGTIQKAEKTTHDVKVQYDVVTKTGKKMFEASVGVDGKIFGKKALKAGSGKEENEKNEYK
jgi:hypothetical protein